MREGDFTWDADQSGFTGFLNLNTAKLEAYMVQQGGDSVQVEFEVRFSIGGKLKTFLPGPFNPITIVANDDEGGDPPISILEGWPPLICRCNCAIAPAANSTS